MRQYWKSVIMMLVYPMLLSVTSYCLAFSTFLHMIVAFLVCPLSIPLCWLRQMRLQRMEELIRSDRLSISDKSELEMYLQDFDKIPEAVAPAIKAKYYDLKREWQNKN